MITQELFQTNFTGGVMDKPMHGRLDMNQYDRSAEIINNARVTPQGSLVRRGGLRYVATLDIEDTEDDDEMPVRLLGFEFNTEQNYIIAVYAGVIQIFDADSLEFVIELLSDTALYATEELRQLEWTQSADTLIVTHEDVRTARLKRHTSFVEDPLHFTNASNVVRVNHPFHGFVTGALIRFPDLPTTAGIDATEFDTTFEITVIDEGSYSFEVVSNADTTADLGGTTVTAWSFGPCVFDNLPRYDFADHLSPEVLSEEKQAFIFVPDWASGNLGRVNLGGKDVDLYYHEEDSPGVWTLMEQQMAAGFLASGALAPGSVNGTDIDVSYDGTMSTDNEAPTFVVTFKGLNGGKNFPLATLVECPRRAGLVIEQIEQGGTRLEDAWSETRGWPRSVVFHENRLWFGGSKSLPTTLWGSQLGLYFDFDKGDALDDEAVEVTLDTSQLNAIVHLASSRNLLIFTHGAEFYVADSPIAPDSVVVVSPTHHGSSRVRPVHLDSSIVFIQENSRAVRSSQFTFTEDTYKAQEVSLHARSLISNPRDMAGQRHPQDGDYAYVVNDDGTLAVLNLLKEQGVFGWTKFNTRGRFVAIATARDKVFVAVRRDNSVLNPKFYSLEVFDEDYYTDCAIKVEAAEGDQTVTHELLDQVPSVVCRHETYLLGQAEPVPDSGGDFLLRDPLTADHTVEVGISYPVTIKLLPPSVLFARGPLIARRKRIARCSVMLYESGSVSVNGFIIPQTVMLGTEITLGEAPPLLNGHHATTLLGWAKTPQIEIRQTDPMPLTLMAVAQTLEASGGLEDTVDPQQRRGGATTGGE